MTINGYSKRGNPILDISRNYRDGQPSKDAGNTYTTLVFGNGANRPNVRASVDSATATNEAYLQEVGVRMGSAGSETHGGGDVMLFADGADAKAFRARSTTRRCSVSCARRSVSESVDCMRNGNAR